jgi:hypothetical protein
MTDEENRKAFEAFACELNTVRTDSGRYSMPNTEWAWSVWQAAAELQRPSIDTAAIAWAYYKLRDFGVLDNAGENPMMADRLMAMMQGRP